MGISAGGSYSIKIIYTGFDEDVELDMQRAAGREPNDVSYDSESGKRTLEFYFATHVAARGRMKKLIALKSRANAEAKEAGRYLGMWISDIRSNDF